MTFKEAFASARKAGKKEFTWNGKIYNTELKESVRPKARAVGSSKSSDSRNTQRPGSAFKINGVGMNERPKARSSKMGDIYPRPMSRAEGARKTDTKKKMKAAGQLEF